MKMHISDYDHIEAFQLDEMPTPETNQDPYAELYDSLDPASPAFCEMPLSPEAEEILIAEMAVRRIREIDHLVEELLIEKSFLEERI